MTKNIIFLFCAIFSISNLSAEYLLKQAIKEETVSAFNIEEPAKKESCLDFYNAGQTTNGVYQIQPEGVTSPFPVYCDMNNGGWTLISRFSNTDADRWIATNELWYVTTSELGSTTSPSTNSDMISKAFWSVKGTEMMFTRSDNTSNVLMKTTSNCLNNDDFRGKLNRLGYLNTGDIWAVSSVRGNCPAQFTSLASSTTGFENYSCSSSIGAPNSISFFADWSQGDGAVIMVGGGGSCGRADHGIGVTEEDSAKFGGTITPRHDFGQNNDGGNSTAYSINLYVK